MKVLLINPPTTQTIVGNNPTIIDQERGYNPPLGLLYVAAYLEKYSSHTVEVIDAQAQEIDYKELSNIITTKQPDVVGITALTFTILDVLKTAKIVKECSRDILTVLGGPHVFLYPQETIRFQDIDYLLLGEGEISFTQLIDSLNGNGNMEDIHGLVYKKNGQIIQTQSPHLLTDLDILPFPARHLTKYQNYSSLLAKGSPITTMFTSRGCPYRCSFCARPHLGKRFRARCAKNVVDEMQECIEMGIKEILIYDDTFTVNKQRSIDICKEIINRRLDIGWDIRARVNTMDEELLLYLKKANCQRIHYGVEAGTDKILKVLRKEITIQDVTSVFKMTKDIGISTLAYFMIGSPTETKEDILSTIEFAKRLKPDFVHITIFTPFPGTELYTEGLNQGVWKNDFWQEFAYAPSTEFVPKYWDKELSQEELFALLKLAYKRFYVRPKYIFKELLSIKSREEFLKKVKAGFKVLGW